jgi:hypothetical protein
MTVYAYVAIKYTINVNVVMKEESCREEGCYPNRS